MNLASIFRKYLSGNESGQLVIKFAGENHLCKVAIEAGHAVYLTCGTLGPAEALGYIAGKTPTGANFIPGVPARRKLATPLDERLLTLAGANQTPAPAAVAAGGADPVAAKQVEETINDFIDLVGPLGTVLVGNILGRLGCRRGEQMQQEHFARFLSALQQEIPEESRRQFQARHQP